MKEFKVYVLVDPSTISIRYIGITKDTVEQRLSRHLVETRHDREKNTHKKNWINSVLKLNAKPIVRCIASFDTRKEAATCENELILKYKDKHRLTNEIVDEGKFTSKGYRSAEKVLSKQVYIYNYQGVYIQSYPSRKEAALGLGIAHSGVKKCLSGEYKYVKGYQFSSTKVDTMPNLDSYSTGSSEEVFIKDNISGVITRYKSCVELCEKLSIPRTTTNIPKMLGTLNKYYGNQYSMLIDGRYQQSVYWNTAVVVQCENQDYSFKSRKELFQSMGYKAKGIAEGKLIQLTKQNFKQVKDIKFNEPLCEVTHID